LRQVQDKRGDQESHERHAQERQARRLWSLSELWDQSLPHRASV